MGLKGDDYKPARDAARLGGGMLRVLKVMIDGEPRTIPEIITQARVSPMSASRFIRYLRKPEFGGFIINKNYITGGLYYYSLQVPASGDQIKMAI